jgi:subtilisin family serine protease
LVALALSPVAGAASQRGFVDFVPTTKHMTPLPMISPPPRNNGTMHWYRARASTRLLLAERDDFGPAAVIGLTSNADLTALRKAYGFARVEALPDLHAAEVSVDQAQLSRLLSTAATDKRIRYVQPTAGPKRELFRLRNDPKLRTINPAINAPWEWEFARTRLDLALNLSTGNPSIVVGVVDSGVGDVPDLTGKVDARWYFSGQETGGDDTEGHGTAVSSLIAANDDDGFGMAGFGGATHIISFRDDILSDTSIAIAIDKLDSLGVRVINLSLGGPNPTAPVLADSLHKAMADGVLVVAAAGNNFAQTVSYPASDLQPPGGGQSYGLAVGASNFDDTRASFSNTGTHLSLVAPGNYLQLCTGVLTALPPVANDFDGTCYPEFAGDQGARYAYVAGTSFSSPEVAGAAALLWAAAPQLRNFEVADILKREAHRDPATNYWTTTSGWGRLDAAAALEDATGRSSADVLKMSSFTMQQHPVLRNGLVTAQAYVAWAADGTAPDSATAACSASANGTPLTAVVQTLAAGVVTCEWTATPALDRQTLTGKIVVTDGPTGVSGTLPFTTSLGDLRAPTVRALGATGKWGTSIGLRFTGSEDSGSTDAHVIVKRGARTIAHVDHGFFALHSGKTYSFPWHAPASHVSGTFTYCVVLDDHAGNASAQACGPISLS